MCFISGEMWRGSATQVQCIQTLLKSISRLDHNHSNLKDPFRAAPEWSQITNRKVVQFQLSCYIKDINLTVSLHTVCLDRAFDYIMMKCFML